MTQQTRDTGVRLEIVVEGAIAKAFAVFTEGIGTWFPPEYNLLPVPIAERVFEPRLGGRVYDRGTDGSICQWARVLAYEPPRRVVISWDISPHWQIETDLARTSEVEVRFIEEGPNRTRVELEHRRLERHGEGWEQQRKDLASDAGWPGAMRHYAKRMAS
jgi:uncharacterized protein YndB with AHSA1/START domain